VKTVASAGTGAAAAVACTGTAVSMAISLGKADAVAAVAGACQAVFTQSSKNTGHTPIKIFLSFHLFKFVQAQLTSNMPQRPTPEGRGKQSYAAL